MLMRDFIIYSYRAFDFLNYQSSLLYLLCFFPYDSYPEERIIVLSILALLSVYFIPYISLSKYPL